MKARIAVLSTVVLAALAFVAFAQAHVTVSTGVVSHTLTFHEPAAAGEWLLLAHHSPDATSSASCGRRGHWRSAASASDKRRSRSRP